ncbi:hypothetical protein [Roseimaritima ulvae]|uniref:Uncharacterized protein n=1 Tax=Roseimaritima ulvae TaxID=980254 RepID=A0A5B9QS41_9BACT|nr:hypothetical protein [Roseimaritima ulvae]QEG39846.1 hypothetical protein UC8_18450 [Roseimaritima ulvae]
MNHKAPACEAAKRAECYRLTYGLEFSRPPNDPFLAASSLLLPHASPPPPPESLVRARNVSPSPAVGTRTLLVLLVVLMLQVGLPQLRGLGDVRHAVWLGCMWGGLSVATWLLAGGRQSLWALGLLLAVAAWHISWMHHVSLRPLSRYVLSMGGLVIVQALSMLLTGSSSWHWPGFDKPARTAPRPVQFNIASLLVLTLVCAAGFAAVRHFESDDQLFYPGIALAVGTLVTITLFAQRLARGANMNWWWGAGLVGTVVGGAYALAALAAINDQLRSQASSVQYIDRTELILAVFAVVVWTGVRSGRVGEWESGRVGEWGVGSGEWGVRSGRVGEWESGGKSEI